VTRDFQVEERKTVMDGYVDCSMSRTTVEMKEKLFLLFKALLSNKVKEESDLFLYVKSIVLIYFI